MSDQEIGKKVLEGTELEPFLEAYEWVTGDTLKVIEANESPDFICERPDGSRVGVELTEVTCDKNLIFAEKVLDRKYEIDPYEAADIIHCLLGRKEENRATRYVLKVVKNILVLLLVDGSLDTHQCEELGAVEWSLDPPEKLTMSLIGPDPSPIYHFFSKLLWVKDGMATETGRQMATIRHDRMLKFLRDYKLEMEIEEEGENTLTPRANREE